MSTQQDSSKQRHEIYGRVEISLTELSKLTEYARVTTEVIQCILDLPDKTEESKQAGEKASEIFNVYKEWLDMRMWITSFRESLLRRFLTSISNDPAKVQQLIQNMGRSLLS